MCVVVKINKEFRIIRNNNYLIAVANNNNKFNSQELCIVLFVFEWNCMSVILRDGGSGSTRGRAASSSTILTYFEFSPTQY